MSYALLILAAVGAAPACHGFPSREFLVPDDLTGDRALLGNATRKLARAEPLCHVAHGFSTIVWASSTGSDALDFDLLFDPWPPDGPPQDLLQDVRDRRALRRHQFGEQDGDDGAEGQHHGDQLAARYARALSLAELANFLAQHNELFALVARGRHDAVRFRLDLPPVAAPLHWPHHAELFLVLRAIIFILLLCTHGVQHVSRHLCQG